MENPLASYVLGGDLCKMIDINIEINIDDVDDLYIIGLADESIILHFYVVR